jgi:cytoplasmic tRNA 2-thiolation protein 2
MSHTRPGKTSGNALIAVSGGAGSMTLFDILTKADFNYVGRKGAELVEKRPGTKEPIWERGTVVYVEFCGTMDGGIDRTEEMQELAESRGMDFIGLRAEDVFDPALGAKLGRAGNSADQVFADLSHPDLPIASSSTSKSPLESLRDLLSSLPPPSRPSLLSRILDHLLALAANSLPNISHLLLGETSSRQAERIISGTALGRGWALPLELAAAYKLPQAESNQVTQLKPLKDITIKEAAIWCHNNRLSTMNSRGWGSVKGKDDGKRDARGKGGVASLEMLTERKLIRT